VAMVSPVTLSSSSMSMGAKANHVLIAPNF
jgi:hypothetical protein